MKKGNPVKPVWSLAMSRGYLDLSGEEPRRRRKGWFGEGVAWW